MSSVLQDLRFALRTFRRRRGSRAGGARARHRDRRQHRDVLGRQRGDVQAAVGPGGRAGGLFSRERARPDEYRAFSYPNYVDIRDQSGEMFDGLMAHMFAMVGEPAGDTTRRVFVSTWCRPTTSTRWACSSPPAARSRADEEHPAARCPSSIVGYDRWRDAGLRPAFIGSQIRINAIDFTVVGVAPQRVHRHHGAGVAGDVAAARHVRCRRQRHVQDARNRSMDRTQPRARRGRPPEAPGCAVATATERLDASRRAPEAGLSAENRDQALIVNQLPRHVHQHVAAGGHRRCDRVGAADGAGRRRAAHRVPQHRQHAARAGLGRRREIAIRLASAAAAAASSGNCSPSRCCWRCAGVGGGSAAGLLVDAAAVRHAGAVLPLTVTFEPHPDLNVLVAATVLAVIATVLFGIGPACAPRRATSSTT